MTHESQSSLHRLIMNTHLFVSVSPSGVKSTWSVWVDSFTCNPIILQLTASALWIPSSLLHLLSTGGILPDEWWLLILYLPDFYLLDLVGPLSLFISALLYVLRYKHLQLNHFVEKLLSMKDYKKTMDFWKYIEFLK